MGVSQRTQAIAQMAVVAGAPMYHRWSAWHLAGDAVSRICIQVPGSVADTDRCHALSAPAADLALGRSGAAARGTADSGEGRRRFLSIWRGHLWRLFWRRHRHSDDQLAQLDG